MAKILVIHGPNLNLLGTREPEIYGHTTLDQLNQQLSHLAEADGVFLSCFQSNAEHALVEKVHQAKQDAFDFIILNAAAFTHTSVALRDALSAIQIPFMEVHLSNVYAREPFRHHSYLSDKAVGVISGLGVESYFAALRFAIQTLTS